MNTTEHGVRITVKNDLGNATTQMSFSPKKETIPHPPDINVETSSTSLVVSFNLQYDIMSNDEYYRYQVRYCLRSSPNNWTMDSNDYNYHYDTVKIIGLDYYTEYNLQARSRFLNNEWSDWGPTTSTQTLEGVPGTGPVILLVQSEKTNATVLFISCQPPEKPNGVITNYHIYYQKNTSGSDIVKRSIQFLGKITYRLQGMEAFTQYVVWMTASTKVGEGASSLKIVHSTSQQEVPSSPDIDHVTGIGVTGENTTRTKPSRIPVIILAPSIIILALFVVVYIYKKEYHIKYFRSWPEPRIPIITMYPSVSPHPIEKETFDDLLTKRPDEFNEDNVDEDASYLQEQGKQREERAPLKTGKTNTGLEFFHMNYEGNLVGGEVCYPYESSELEEEYTHMMPISETTTNSIQPPFNDCTYVYTTVSNEETDFSCATKTDSTGSENGDEDPDPPHAIEHLSTGYIALDDFRIMHQNSEA
ncbi:uncharacterized protein [Antedon mediterranea]|uniref:uncharacterized protein n=1 Tax=Antedon mediterranea TaxID=105859 RepID=UPI003AF51E28